MPVGDLVPCDGSANAADPVTQGQVQLDLHERHGQDCREDRSPPLSGLAPPAPRAAGNTYEIAVFSRDGHPTESNFQLTLSGFSTNMSHVRPHCGDGVTHRRRGVRLRRDGHALRAPLLRRHEQRRHRLRRLHDEVQVRAVLRRRHGQRRTEECDLGSAMNTATYGAMGCTPGCKKPALLRRRTRRRERGRAVRPGREQRHAHRCVGDILHDGTWEGQPPRRLQ